MISPGGGRPLGANAGPLLWISEGGTGCQQRERHHRRQPLPAHRPSHRLVGDPIMVMRPRGKMSPAPMDGTERLPLPPETVITVGWVFAPAASSASNENARVPPTDWVAAPPPPPTNTVTRP